MSHFSLFFKLLDKGVQKVLVAGETGCGGIAFLLGFSVLCWGMFDPEHNVDAAPQHRSTAAPQHSSTAAQRSPAAPQRSAAGY